MDSVMKKKIKVLFLLENPLMGGINARSLRLAEGFKKYSKCEINFAVLTSSDTGWLFDAAERKGVQVDKIKCAGPLDFLVINRIRKYILDNQVDIVHSQQYRGNFWVRLLLDLSRMKFRTVITKPGMLVRRQLRTYLYYELDKRPTLLADKVIAVDSSTYKSLIEWGVKIDKLTIINNPISVSEVKPESSKKLKEKFLIPSSCQIVLYTGRLDIMKGLRELIYATKIISERDREFKVILVGDGPDRLVLEELVCELNVQDKIIFAGEEVDLSAYYSTGDFLVLPSYSEGFPNSILEAFSYGKPVVATNVGGIPDLVENSKSGVLVQKGDVLALADAMDQFITNPIRTSEMGAYGKSVVAEKFSMEKAIMLYDEVYQSIM